MSAGFLGRSRRPRRRLTALAAFRALFWEYYPTALTLIVGVTLSLVLTWVMEQRLYPVLHTAARAQTENAVAAVMERAVMSELDGLGLSYGDLVSVERIEDGSVTAITTDMTAMNRLRSSLMERLLPSLMGIDKRDIAVPVGSLLKSELLWGRGPTIKVRSFSVGSVRADFESEFMTAGVNQTLHKIWLTLSAPTTVLLPGSQLEVEVQTRLCVAETVIVGKVPSYVQKAYG